MTNIEMLKAWRRYHQSRVDMLRLFPSPNRHTMLLRMEGKVEGLTEAMGLVHEV